MEVGVAACLFKRFLGAGGGLSLGLSDGSDDETWCRVSVGGQVEELFRNRVDRLVRRVKMFAPGEQLDSSRPERLMVEQFDRGRPDALRELREEPSLRQFDFYHRATLDGSPSTPPEPRRISLRSPPPSTHTRTQPLPSP